MSALQLIVCIGAFLCGTTALFLLMASMASKNNIKTETNIQPMLIFKNGKMYIDQQACNDNDPLTPEEIEDLFGGDPEDLEYQED